MAGKAPETKNVEKWTGEQQPETPFKEEAELEVFDSFDKMNLKDNLLRGIFAYGFEKPSYIQQKAIVPLSKSRDLLAQAQSGTGKTGSYTIGMLQLIDEKRREAQALILTPTRELAQQVQYVVSCLGDYMEIVVHACIGGTSIREEINTLRKGVHVVVGTPGRVYDMIQRGELLPQKFKIVILDEADEMLSKGFHDQIKAIFQTLPEDTQAAVFSATFSPEALDVTTKCLRNPIKIVVKKEELTLQGITQFFVNVERENWKLDTLCDIYEAISISQSVIFCNSRKKVDWLTDKMKSRDFPVSSIHSGLEHVERYRIMDDFRRGRSRVLITTDLLARGIDIQQVSVVINYDIPLQLENYIHRIGRSGRFGRKGLAITFITEEEYRSLQDLQRYYDTQIEPLPNPSTLMNYL